MNKVILKGRTTKEPEIKFIQTDQGRQQCYARFTLAVDDWSFKDNETGKCHVDYIPCYCFNKTAEIINNNVKKGTELVIFGKFRSSSFMKNNQMEYRNNLQVMEVEFCGKKEEISSKQNSSDKPIRLYWEHEKQEEFDMQEELDKIRQGYKDRKRAVK